MSLIDFILFADQPRDVIEKAIAELANSTNIPHFERLLKESRNGHYSFKIALKDIIDNAILKAKCMEINVEFLEGKLNRIIISDDCIHGFENINEKGATNPMNWGTSRPGQKDDHETSEYGKGLKSGSSFLANVMHIVTRSVKDDIVSLCEVKCNFDEMASRPNVLDSYRTVVTEIDPIAYKNLHPFETGSSVILSEMRLIEDMQFTSNEECITIIRELVSEAFSDIIEKRSNEEGFVIHVNGVPIVPEDDKYHGILQHPFCEMQMVTSTIVAGNIHLPNPKIMVKIELSDKLNQQYIAKQLEKKSKRVSKNTLSSKQKQTPEINSYPKYYIVTPMIPEKDKKEKKDNKEKISMRETTTISDKNDYEQMTRDETCYKKTIRSTSTFGSDLENTHQFKSSLRIKRDGRNYGDIELVNLLNSVSGDGWINHIYHQLDYMSKELNRFVGICSNKQINPKKENCIMATIRKLVRTHNTFLDKRKLCGEDSSDNDYNSDTNSVVSTSTSISDITMSSSIKSIKRSKPIKKTQQPIVIIPVQPALPTASSTPNASISPSSTSSALSLSSSANIASDNAIAENLSGMHLESEVPIISSTIQRQLEESIENATNTISDLLPTTDPDENIHMHLQPIGSSRDQEDDNTHIEAVSRNTLRRSNVQYGTITNQDRTYLSCKDALIQLNNLSLYGTENPSINIVDDLMDVLHDIVRQKGKHLYMIDLLKRCMTHGVTDDARVVGGSKLAEIHSKYINEDDIEL